MHPDTATTMSTTGAHQATGNLEFSVKLTPPFVSGGMCVCVCAHAIVDVHNLPYVSTFHLISVHDHLMFKRTTVMASKRPHLFKVCGVQSLHFAWVE